MKKYLFFIISILSLASCKKFLEEYSPTDMKPVTVTHFSELLVSDGYPDREVVFHPWLTFLDDDVQAYFGSSPNFDAFQLARARRIFQWQPDFTSDASAGGDKEDMNAWAVYYRRMMGANVVLGRIQGAEGLQAEKDQLKGEVYILRAFYHFNLVNLYGRPYNDSTTTPDQSAGIPIRTSGDLSEAYLARNTVKEVYTQIVKDLDSGLYFLDLNRKTMPKTRISHTAGQLFASRVYLFMEEWEKCIVHADAALRDHAILMDYNTIGNQMLIGPGNVETIWCYGSKNDHLPTNFGVAYDISHDLANQFEENDLRRTVAFAEIEEILRPYIPVDYMQKKNKHNNLLGGTSLTPISWRSSEAYLNRAEAYIQLYRIRGNAGDAQKALASLNTLRESRMAAGTFQPWEIAPADVLLHMCRDERRRELFKEETHRWFDLRRYGMPAIRHIYKPAYTVNEVYTLTKRDPMYVLPIPVEVMERNPAIIPNPLPAGARLPD